TIWEYTVASFASAFGAAFGMIPLLFTEIKWRPEVSALRSKHVLALGRGIALALPLILVFGFLLAGADPVFGSFVGKAFSVNLDFGDLVAQLLIMIVCTWFAGGYMRRVLASVEVPDHPAGHICRWCASGHRHGRVSGAEVPAGDAPVARKQP